MSDLLFSIHAGTHTHTHTHYIFTNNVQFFSTQGPLSNQAAAKERKH